MSTQTGVDIREIPQGAFLSRSAHLKMVSATRGSVVCPLAAKAHLCFFPFPPQHMPSHNTTTPRASMNPQATRRALDSLVAQNAATGIVAKASWPFALARLAPNEASFGANLGCSRWSRSLQLLKPGRKLSGFSLFAGNRSVCVCVSLQNGEFI